MSYPLYPPLDVPATGDKPFTDYARWRLLVNDGGRHTWHYLRTDEECAKWPQTELDKYWLGVPTGLPALPKATTPLEAARNGYEFYKHLQADDGHWPGEYGGVMFLFPGLVIGSYITGMSFTHEEKLELVRLLINRAHPEDGGWGIHQEGHSTVFGTALNYCALRLLGVPAEHPVAVRARGALHKLGGATGIPAWGKFWLSVLNVYEWEGNNPIPPDLWLLPDWLPIHPHRWWIHTRNVYIPMSYLWGIRFKAKEDSTILALREELYTQDYYSIDWPAQRNNVCPADVYSPHTKILDVLNALLGVVDPCFLSLPFIRNRSLARVYELVVMEDENTGYQTLGPVSKMMNQICRYVVDGPDSESWKLHKEKRHDFMWLGAEGMMMTGTNGSQLWDIAFITQALVESGLAEEEANRPSLGKALEWLDETQMTENPKHFHEAYRHATKGAWPFSTKEQGYTVSDCTGEGLKASLYIQEHLNFTSKRISDDRLCDAVDILLSMQNADGSYASYELIRGPLWLEKLNPAEVFGDIMTEFPYPECTTSSITALAHFRKHNSTYRSADIDKCIKDAVGYIYRAQKPHGGWVGSWGICFTYATQFALESLALVGESYENSPRVRRACEFLLGKQRADGGWGESYKSCELAEWVEHKQTQVVGTCWGALALMYARYPYPEPIERAVKMVMDRQLSDGSWAQESIEGVFNKNVAIAYPNFKFSFTIWMLGRAHWYLAELKAARSTNGHANGHSNGHGNGNSH